MNVFVIEPSNVVNQVSDKIYYLLIYKIDENIIEHIGNFITFFYTN